MYDIIKLVFREKRAKNKALWNFVSFHGGPHCVKFNVFVKEYEVKSGNFQSLTVKQFFNNCCGVIFAGIRTGALQKIESHHEEGGLSANIPGHSQEFEALLFNSILRPDQSILPSEKMTWRQQSKSTGVAITKLLVESNREFVNCTEKASISKEFDKLD